LIDLKEEVDRAGGFIVLAHPFRGFLIVGLGQTGQTVENAMTRALFKHVHAVETLNGKVTPNENRFASQVAEGLGLPATGGSDAHEVDEVGKYATRFQTEIRNERDLIQALKSGAYQPAAFRRERGL
jgi:predicted metal-dependent phosphoesterase TrpH